jgi:lipopolysaccharide heptosyltransferase II
MPAMSAKRILIFNVNWLGDVLFSTAAIRNIRYNFPRAFLSCIIPIRCYEVLEKNPYLDEIIFFDEKNKHGSLVSKLKFISYLKSRRFDIVYLLHRSFTRALITYLAGIPQRVGYDTLKRGWLLTNRIIPPPRDSLHRIDYYLNIIEQAGLIIKYKCPEFFTDIEAEKYVDGFLSRQGLSKEDFLIAINPGGNWLLKRWKPEYIAQLADRLIREFKAKVIITGSVKDRGLVEEIIKAMENRPIETAGKFGLKQLGALLKRVKVFISADSGPLHIANSLGAGQVIALYGPTSACVTGPRPRDKVIILQKDVGCKIPCYKLDCPDNRCMKAITVEDVIAKIATLLPYD